MQYDGAPLALNMSITLIAKRFFVWLLAICTCVILGIAQSNVDGISLNVTTKTQLFSRDTKPRATIRIENKSGKPLSLSMFESFIIELESTSKVRELCRSGECYMAGLRLKEKAILNDRAFTYNVSIEDLYWHNSVSSAWNLDHPRNFFTEVQGGEYLMSASLIVKADNWKADDPRFHRIKSNVVGPVTVSYGK